MIERNKDKREGDLSSRQEQLDRLIQKAVAQPGLAAMMEVYQSAWFRLGTQMIQVPMPNGKVTVSTNSMPPAA